jgi:hypothetical protein
MNSDLALTQPGQHTHVLNGLFASGAVSDQIRMEPGSDHMEPPQPATPDATRSLIGM